MKLKFPLLLMLLAIIIAGCNNNSTVTEPDVTLSSGEVFRTDAIYDGPFAISADDRYILDSNNKKVLLIGDAGWHFMARLDSTDIYNYLSDRKDQGFNAILCALIVTDGYYKDNDPQPSDFLNAYGYAPFSNLTNWTTGYNEEYWGVVDYAFETAEDLGLILIANPAYIGYTCGYEGWASKMAAQSTADMYDYGEWIGNRYGSFNNVIWTGGGDANALSESQCTINTKSVYDRVDALMDGLLSVDTNALATAHTKRGNTGTPYIVGLASAHYNESWLDIENSYGTENTTAKWCFEAYNASTTRPAFNIEGRYEGEGTSTTHQDMRMQAYHSVLGGMFGHVYGAGPFCNNGADYDNGECSLWNFASGWENNMNLTGADDMIHVSNLMLSRDFGDLYPDYDDTVVVSSRGSMTLGTYIACANNNRVGIVYMPKDGSSSVTIDPTFITAASTFYVHWYNPRTGAVTTLANAYSVNAGNRTYTRPGSNDWVLVLDAAGEFDCDPGVISCDPPDPPIPTGYGVNSSL